MTELFRMPTAAGDGIELKRYEDIIVPSVVDPVWGIKHAKAFKYRPGDIITCTYPKCGTNWMGHMIWKLKTLDHSKRPGDALLEAGPVEILENMDSPRVLHTHLKPSRLPAEHLKNGGKIVVTIRNPKDVMVSFYYLLKNATAFKNKQTWDEYAQSFISGLVPLGSYFDYVQQWEQFLKENSNDQQVEVFYYEDFKANPKENLKRLNGFLGFNRDEQYIEQVMEATTLPALKEQDANETRDIWPLAKDEKGRSVIYRKGEVGDWKNYLTVAQSELVDKIMGERLQYGLLNIKYEI